MTSRERKAIVWLSAVLLACLLVTGPVLYDSRRMAWIRRQARTLKAGDSKAKVERTLGRANEAWEKETSKAFSTGPSPLLKIVRVQGVPKAIDRTTKLWGVTNAGETYTIIEISELWIYGSRFDWRNSLRREFPFVWPFRRRAWWPDPSDDVVIEFDDDGNVSVIRGRGALADRPGQVFVDD